MSTTAPSANIRPASQPLRVPPDENMWVKYSPHHEAPLSFVGSLAIHILVVVLLAIIGFLAYMYFSPPPLPLPIDTIRMPGGGGGNPNGEGNAPGIGTGPKEVVDDPNAKDRTESDPEVKRPPLDPTEVKALPVEFKDNPAMQRYVVDGNEELKKIARLNP